jgi:hypothetical protein
MTERPRIPEEVLKALNYQDEQEAALDMLLLSAKAKRAQFLSEMERFEAKYGMGFEAFVKKVNARRVEEVFDEEDDLMAWRFAKEAAEYWELKVKELGRAA